MKTLALVLFFVVIGDQGCAHTSANCTTACARGAALGCAWATPTPLSATCLDVCQNAAQSVPWDVANLTITTNCGP